MVKRRPTQAATEKFKPVTPMLRSSDVDPKFREAMEASLREQYPDAKIAFAGDMDMNDLPEEVRRQFEEIEYRHAHSIFTGTCLDCGAKMPGYPDTPADDATDEDIDKFQTTLNGLKPVEGWRAFTDDADNLDAWQCPD